MKTIERNTTYELTEKAPVRAATRRTWWLLAAVAVLALAAGLFVGRWTAPSDEPAYLAGGGALSDRQEQMLDVLDEAVLGWRAGDPEAVAATFVPTGYATYAGQSYRIDDGTLATFVTGGDWSSLTVLEPVLVDGNTLTFYYEISGVHYLGSVEFTGTGDVLAVHQGIDL
jgi:hypothetical protein